MKRVAILGAGLTGLSAGYFLKKHGLECKLFEAAPHYGGPLQTGTEENFQYEYGPNTLLSQDSHLENLIAELGLSDQVVEANPKAKKRFVVQYAQPVPLPMSLRSFLTSPILSTRAKLSLLTEPFRPRSHLPDESLAAFAQRRLGLEVLNYLLNPFVAGIYAGSPENLSTKYAFPLIWELEQTHGSLLVGLLKKRISQKSPKSRRRLISFQHGIQTLCHALAKNLKEEIHLNTPVETIQQEGAQWCINGESFAAVISTLPTYAFNKIPSKPDTLHLENLPHPPVSVWHLGFKRDQITHPLDGFGMLVPAVENLNILGCLFPSTLFPNRAPKDAVLLTIFVGGSRQPHLAFLNEAESLALVLNDLNLLLGIKGLPYWKKRIQWPHAIPQYELGYEKFLNSLDSLESSHAGFFFAGNFRGGIAAPHCINTGKEIARNLSLKFGIS